MFLLFARHGETTENKTRRFQGNKCPGPGLNRTGRAQAARLADRLRNAGLTAIVSSDLERAVETTRIVAAETRLAPSFDPDLREVDVGDWTGKSYDEVAEQNPEEWAAWSAGIDVRRGGGETYAELALRVERAVSRIERGRVLVVSHGGAIKSFVAKMLGVSNEGLRALAGIANAGLTVIERDTQGRHRMHAFNDTAHLEGLVVDEHSE
jgi:probable phosphoglycerate mutase